MHFLHLPPQTLKASQGEDSALVNFIQGLNHLYEQMGTMEVTVSLQKEFAKTLGKHSILFA